MTRREGNIPDRDTGKNGKFFKSVPTALVGAAGLSVGRKLIGTSVGSGSVDTSLGVGSVCRDIGRGWVNRYLGRGDQRGYRLGEDQWGTSVEMGSGETLVGREGRASERLTAMGEATSEGKENGKAVELKVGKGQAVRFPESERGALGVLEKAGVVPLNPEGGGGWHQSWEMGE